MPRSAVKLDLTFQALADPTRRAMVERLARGQASVSGRPALRDVAARHRPALGDAGKQRVGALGSGRVRTYSMVPAALSMAEKWFNQRRAQWEQRLDRLGEHLKQFPDGEPK